MVFEDLFFVECSNAFTITSIDEVGFESRDCKADLCHAVGFSLMDIAFSLRSSVQYVKFLFWIDQVFVG